MPARRSTRQGRARPRRVTPKRRTRRLVARRRRAGPTLVKRIRRKVRAVRPRRTIQTALLPPLPTAPPTALPPQPSYISPPQAATGRPEDRFVIPAGYGETKLVLLVRDPWWLYAYWEIRGEHSDDIRRQIPDRERSMARSVLRLYEVAEDEVWHPCGDIQLKELANNWYIHVGEPNHSWMAELGWLTASGKFYPLVRSNLVRTPRYGPSEVIDEEWMCPDDDYWKLFGVAGGFGIGRSSLEVRERFAQQPLEFWSSSQAHTARGPTRRTRPSAVRKPASPPPNASVRSA